MKSHTLKRVSAMLSSAALLAGVQLLAQDYKSGQPVAYSVVSLATLGGTSGTGNTINDRNWPMGSGNLAGNESARATIWLEGLTFDLGTLGGPNSGVEWPAEEQPRRDLGNCRNHNRKSVGRELELFCLLPGRHR